MFRHDFLTTYHHYLKHEQGRSASCVKNYYLMVRRVLRVLLPKDPLTITVEDIENLKHRLLKNGIAVSTTNNYVLACRAFFRMLEEKGYRISLRPQVLRTFKQAPSRVDYLTFDEFDEIARTIKQHTLQGLRLRALIEVLFGTGLRISEALSLKRNQFVHNQARVIGKGQRERTVYITNRALYWVGRYLAKRTDQSEMLFVELLTPKPLSRDSAEQILRRLGHNRGRRLHPHLFRHSIATELYRRTKDLGLVKDILGHARIDTTDRFYRGTNEEEVKQRLLWAMDGYTPTTTPRRPSRDSLLDNTPFSEWQTHNRDG